MDSGLYVTFFNRDEPHDRELPPVGPLDQLVLRHGQLVAQRSSVHQAHDLGVSIDRWLEAELELQRATGEEPGGTKRPELRVTAPDGVFLRFAVFGDARERDPIPELGPFAVVVVGPRGVEGDGQLLATRTASELAPWDLSSGAGHDLAGLHKPDIAFRNATGAYHASIALTPTEGAVQIEPPFLPVPPELQPVLAPPPPMPGEPAFTALPRAEPPFVPQRAEPSFDPATSERLFKPREEHASAPTPPPVRRPAEEVPALTARDLELIERMDRERAEETLRARVQEEERRRLGVDQPLEDDPTTWAMRYRPQEATAQDAVEVGGGLSLGALLWRVRFAIIGVLLVGVGAYGFTAIRTGTAPNAAGVQPLSYVGVGTKFTGTRWDWVVNGVQRVADAGNAKAQGIYYVVRVGATNKGTEGAQVAPNDFVLVDPGGIEHSALGVASGAYQSPSNAGSSNIWPREFPVGKTVNFNVVFDIDPGLGRGMTLGIADVPRMRVRLD